MKTVSKSWGREEWLVNTELYCAKYLYINNKHSTSLHFHKTKDETFYIVSGVVCVSIEEMGEIYGNILCAGNKRRVRTRSLHKIEGRSDDAIVLEVSTHHDDTDSFRLQQEG